MEKKKVKKTYIVTRINIDIKTTNTKYFPNRT